MQHLRDNIAQPAALAATLLLALAAPAGADDICGDVDGDGRVNTTDLGIVLADFGCTGGDCPGDIDGDGDTDQQDLAWWSTFYNCDGLGNAPPCGPCAPVGDGAIDVHLTQVDNTTVGPGDDSFHPEFHGGVTHFTFDLLAEVTANNDWTTQCSSVDLLLPEVGFFNHDLDYYDSEPYADLILYFPALEFDSFYATPPALFDDAPSAGFAWGPHWADTSVEAIWFDTPHDDDYTATTQRFTLIVPADSGIAPGVLPDDCPQEYVVMAQLSTDVTAVSTGADLLSYEFTIVDLSQPICPGDIDDDGDVDQSDLGLLLSTYGRPNDDPLYDNRADFDCDSDVDQSDLGTLLGNYGADC